MAIEINDPITLNVLDPADVEQTEFGPDMKRWLSNIVDIINSNFALINNTFTNFITSLGVDIGGGGAGPITVPVVGLTPNPPITGGFVNVSLISTTNPNITIASVVVELNQFKITFSADPGASAIIVYQAYIANPQG